MPRSLQDLLNFADKFEKFAVDTPQPEGFKDDYEKYLALLSRRNNPTTVREMKAVVPADLPTSRELPGNKRPVELEMFEEPPEDVVVIDDLPFDPEEAEKLKRDDDDAKLGVGGHPFDPDEEDVKREKGRAKCDACEGEGYKDGKFCKKCHGTGRGEKEAREAVASENLILIAKKQEKKHKLDPKAKVRNRGTVCVPASQAKDHKDHFPINDIDQARNALARVHQYSSAPSWYKGSLKGLQDLVSRKVHSKYPAIGKDDKKKKKSSADYLFNKYGELRKSASTESALVFLNGCSSTSEALRDIAKAQFELAGHDMENMPPKPETPFSEEDAWKDEHASWQESKKLHDMIMAFADQLEVEEQKTW